MSNIVNAAQSLSFMLNVFSNNVACIAFNYLFIFFCKKGADLLACPMEMDGIAHECQCADNVIGVVFSCELLGSGRVVARAIQATR